MSAFQMRERERERKKGYAQVQTLDGALW